MVITRGQTAAGATTLTGERDREHKRGLTSFGARASTGYLKENAGMTGEGGGV